MRFKGALAFVCCSRNKENSLSREMSLMFAYAAYGSVIAAVCLWTSSLATLRI